MSDVITFESKWSGNRVEFVARNGSLQFADKVDPASQRSRKSLAKAVAERFPNVEVDDLEKHLLEMLEQREKAKPTEQSDSVVAPNPDAWGEAVSGELLLDEVTSLLRRFVILPDLGYETIALWTLHTYVFDVFEYTPRLLLSSPEKRCGKTRTVRTVDALVSRSLACEGLTSAAMFRCIEMYHPTLLLDEADTFLRGRDVNEDLRGVVNSGHQRGGKVIRCVGDDAEPKAFSCFGPVVIAMIGKPPGTVEDRSIAIEMRRKLPGESVERPAPGKPMRTQFNGVVRRCVRWAADARDALAEATPETPAGIDDRAADCWYALLAIADNAGGKWPTLARQAAQSLMGGRDDASLGVQLLADLRDVLGSVNKMTSAGICTELVKLEDRPWCDMRGRHITPRILAKLLDPYGVKPRTIRTAAATAKGYHTADLDEPWTRYVEAQNAAGTVE
tara:strand:+ start:351 stop:1691 length:1341 start_codon:yes stop_codon:yes gene_type:complete